MKLRFAKTEELKLEAGSFLSATGGATESLTDL